MHITRRNLTTLSRAALLAVGGYGLGVIAIPTMLALIAGVLRYAG